MIINRPRRNRQHPAIRAQIRETELNVNRLIFPLFVKDGDSARNPISSLPGLAQLSGDEIYREVEECLKLGIQSIVLFPAVEESLKDSEATYSYAEENFYLHVIRGIKERFPECWLMSDVALDPYSSDGHDGIVKDGKILNDETLEVLAKMSVAQAQAGIDMIGPSDMMDGRVEYIRNSLDDAGYTQTSIMSYTAKYASAFYGPFRDALDSTPKFGDKKTYQMDPANKYEAIREGELDTFEGADFLMVKPALSYLDVIHVMKQHFELPISAYNVSGEYAMIKAAAEKGWLDYEKVMPEVLMSIRRAGADSILTYFAKDYAQMVRDGYTYD